MILGIYLALIIYNLMLTRLSGRNYAEAQRANPHEEEISGTKP